MDGITAFRELQKVAKSRNLDTNGVVERYAQERLLARLFNGPDAIHRLALKGGMLAFLFEGTDTLGGRTTKDLDVQSPGYAFGIGGFTALVERAIAQDLDDGVVFENIRIVAERGDEGVPGGSLKVTALVGKAKVGVKVDVTFDERMDINDCEPGRYPGILGEAFPYARIPWDLFLADKLCAMARHGAVTYRMRDYYDAYLIIKAGEVDLDRVSTFYARTMDMFGSDRDLLVNSGALLWSLAHTRASAWDKERITRNLQAKVPDFVSMVREISEYADLVVARCDELDMRPGA